MSINIAGSLQVIVRSGRNGDFTVGELSTEIGKFRIKNPVLDEFEAGSYEGVFLITRIFNITNVTTTGQVWVSLCADLDWEALKIMNQSETVESETLETVAMIEEVVETQPEPENSEQETTHDDDLISDLDALQALLDANADEIKLDSTLTDRDLFRQLREAIKATEKYRFMANGQKWVRKEA